MINRKSIEWYLALFALLTLLIGWWAGKRAEKDEDISNIIKLYPYHSYNIKSVSPKVYKLYPKSGLPFSYVILGTGKGYAGPLRIVARYDKNGKLENIDIIDSKETPSYQQKVLKHNYLYNFKHTGLPLIIENDFTTDAITGATKTCEGIVEALRHSAIELAEIKNINIPEQDKQDKIAVSYKEVTVLILLVLGTLARIKKFRYKKYLKWITLISGTIFLGFILNQPITTTRLNSFLMGFWPDWHSELYIYLLVFGILLILLTSGKNVYCGTFCPFGAVQEIIGKAGNVKPYKPKNRLIWTWVQRSYAWSAVLLALIFRSPAISEYEVYSNLFQFTGTTWMFILLALVIITSLFLKRPWRVYLCPVNPIFGFIQLFRKKIKGIINHI